ncbi:TPA: heavy-metal-associated domain-containing protein [Campylobacter coli]|uniref:heavy-metal-associated domain-containing protein n=1 Tax=Campylobacter coli TaxID=195 RepID=UPI00092EB836|nr:heavy-metal-associated domain-containing protein [Campylobacter coli]EAK8578368.1 heavy-metal-associated domain-containing protein [Campylobacter coli]ECK7545181.1 heavy-metal-associated domain-containing protein [Campylobacter coli]ECK7666171.1 heavy-metal-associated domain-containing protein [Campylobacter coli]ECK7817476.1 heavy-metal-associated domain-containing protein [Campylobacter coli]ECK7907406.1 heavy-metal-associated domain-containing protein [Campylobacter coli]
MKFKVANINCQNCANLIKNSLEDIFGEIKIDLDANPRTLSLNLDSLREEEFKKELGELGFEVLEKIE